MNSRKELILKTIIQEYIKTGVPVSSGFLVEKCGLDCSSATVRNEMAELEVGGLIHQPHTSAGRIPTEAAYGWYVQTLVTPSLLPAELVVLQSLLAVSNEVAFKQTAKELAQLSGVAVFWAFHKHNVFYTGLTNLLNQPEFNQTGLIYDISAIIDRLEEIIDDNFEQLPEEPTVFIGSESPFGAFSSSVLCRYKAAGQRGAFGVIGPLRLDFARNLALIQTIKTLIK
jgi:heat-inducible transcriptional repressor